MSTSLIKRELFSYRVFHKWALVVHLPVNVSISAGLLAEFTGIKLFNFTGHVKEQHLVSVISLYWFFCFVFHLFPWWSLLSGFYSLWAWLLSSLFIFLKNRCSGYDPKLSISNVGPWCYTFPRKCHFSCNSQGLFDTLFLYLFSWNIFWKWKELVFNKDTKKGKQRHQGKEGHYYIYYNKSSKFRHSR